MANPANKSNVSKRVLKAKIDSNANVHIKATFNNIIVSFANKIGEVFVWASAGKVGFKGSKKNTPYAAKCASEDCSLKAFGLGVRKADVFVNGSGMGREAAIRAIEASGICVESITDDTPIPYNGCRPPKRRKP